MMGNLVREKKWWGEIKGTSDVEDSSSKSNRNIWITIFKKKVENKGKDSREVPYVQWKPRVAKEGIN